MNPMENAMTDNSTTDKPTESPNVSPMSEIVITVDHVYLPLDESGDGRTDWAVTSVSTTRVSKRTRLWVPDDLALLLSKQEQAEILPAPPPSAPLPSAPLGTGGTGEAGP
jgi:hypothetical protein